MFFFLILSSNFVTYYGLMEILRTLAFPEGKDMKEKVKHYFNIMNLLYFLMIPTALWIAPPKCSNLNIYPASMYLLNVLFLANSVFFWYMQHNKFFMDLPEEKIGDDEHTPMIEKDEHAVARTIFKQQMSSYNCFTWILSIVNVFVILLGRVYVDKGGYLTCTGGGYEWIYQSITGELFGFMLILTMLMQSVMAEKFFYGIPHHNGHFNEGDEKKIEPQDSQIDHVNAVN